MTVHEVFLWSMPLLAILMAVVAWFAVDAAHGRVRSGVVAFFVGLAISATGALLAAYLLWVEEGALVVGLGALVSLGGAILAIVQYAINRSASEPRT